MRRTFTDDILRWLRLHLALAISGGIATYSALSILGLARWDPEIAKTVAQEQSPAEIALGQALNLATFGLPTALSLVILLPALPGGMRRYFGIGIGTCWILSTAALVTLLATVQTWLLVPIIPLMILAVAWLRLIARRSTSSAKERTRMVRLRRSVAGLSGAYMVLALIAMTVTDPWLPREKITFEHGDVTSAYVISSTNAETVLVTLNPHALVRVRTAAIRSRELCEAIPAPLSSLAGPVITFSPSIQIPSCPI